MPDNEKSDHHGNYQDNAGKLYQTLDGKPPGAGTPVKIHENGQTHDGVWDSGTAHKTGS